jgi:hypothetical protein
MNNWKQSLDRYLTTEPEDYFTPYCESVVDKLSDDFYEWHDGWLNEHDGECNKLLSFLFSECIEPSQAAKFIEAIYKIFKP